MYVSNHWHAAYVSVNQMALRYITIDLWPLAYTIVLSDIRKDM